MNKRTIFINSDNPSMENLKNNLINYFYIEDAHTIEDAQKLLIKQYSVVKAVFIDMELFRENDYCFIRMIKSNLVLKHIPIICIGNEYSNKNIVFLENEEALEKGAVNYYTPPFQCSLIRGFLTNLIRLQENAYFAVGSIRSNTYHIETNTANGTFWNPKSIDNLIMHSYIGAVCILESNDGRISIVQTNERFMEELFGKVDNLVTDPSKISRYLERFVGERNLKILENLLGDAAQDDMDTKKCELTLNDREGARLRIHIRLSVKLIQKVNKRALFYCMIENDTSKYEAISRETAMRK